MSLITRPMPMPYYKSTAAVTPNDSTDLTETCKGLWIGVAGTLKYTDAAGNTVSTTVGVGIFPVAIARVWSTGTAATGIVALY